jgi:glycosyltransferase involved in cell wall biosynthesis
MARRLKIAVYHNLPSGGGKRWLHECLRRLSRKHTIDVYTLSDVLDSQFADVTPLVRETYSVPFRELPKLPFWRLNPPLKLIDVLRLNRASRKIAHLIDKRGYDLALVTSCRYTEAPLVLRHLRTPSLYYCHEVFRALYEPPLLRPYQRSLPSVLSLLLDLWAAPYESLLRRWEAQCVRKASLVVTNSHYARESIYKEYGVFPRVNYPGVDVEAFQPNGTVAKEDVVLCVGQISPHKAFDCAVEAIARVSRSLRPKLAIAANSVDEEEKGYIQALAAQHEVSLIIYERVPDEEVQNLYNRAKLTLFTPILEPLGLVPLESMACGTPVIGVREAGIRETVVDGVTGFLVERDHQQLGAAVQRLLEDEDLRAEMGANGRRYVLQNWTWDRSATELESLLSEVAGEAEPAASAARGWHISHHSDITADARRAVR